MRLWRLSGKQHADAFDGSYGLLFDGRWNTVGHAVTYCATSPSLCVLEKLVHIEDPALLPELIMVTYDVPDTLGIGTIRLEDLPSDWRHREAWTQQKGDQWHRQRAAPLLCVPSAIVPLSGSPDVNVLINHSHPASADIKIHALEPFLLDSRLL
jgi:RES domain-containing protein